MNKQLLTIAFVLLACVVGAQGNYHSPYDPGAARNTLSNVTPATGRAALGLGTMAVATSTDYVATDTFTGHTGATGSAVHGLGTISTKAATDYVATSALALRLDTVNASFTGDIDVAGEVQIATSTDAGDYKLQVAGEVYFNGAQTQYRTSPLTIANDGVATLSTIIGTTIEVGELKLVCTSNGSIGMYTGYARSGLGHPIEIADPQNKFTSTKDNASTVNVYLDGDEVYIQNKIGGTVAFWLEFRGYYP